jgi:hypothetical protein
VQPKIRGEVHGVFLAAVATPISLSEEVELDVRGIVPKDLFLGFLSLKLDKVMPGTS